MYREPCNRIMIIRQGTKDDHVQIASLRDAWKKEREVSFSSSTDLFHKKGWSVDATPNSDICFVAEHEGEVVGFLCGNIWTRDGYVADRLGSLEELFVDPSVRRMGVAKDLLRAFDMYGVSQGCAGVIVRTDAENVVAQTLYASYGLSPVTVELWKKL
jgi:ribosomal protein S18 acetylase RimI-like enzyme